jgi:hypothetical protein
MKNISLLFIFCFVFPVTMYAGKTKPAIAVKHHAFTNILTGKVVSGPLGVAFASVTYSSNGHSSTKLTDENGNFTLINIDAGPGLTISAGGYVTKHVSLSSAGGGVVVSLVKL